MLSTQGGRDISLDAMENVNQYMTMVLAQKRFAEFFRGFPDHHEVTFIFCTKMATLYKIIVIEAIASRYCVFS